MSPVIVFHGDAEGDWWNKYMATSQHIHDWILLKLMGYQSPYLLMSDKMLMAHINKVPSYYYREYTGLFVLCALLDSRLM